MNKFFKFVLPAIALAYFGFQFYVKFSGAEEGDLAPDFEAELIDSTPFKLSELQGKYVLLDFWASWCGPCRMANPNLAVLHEKYSDKLTIVTVALEKSGDAWKHAAQQDGFVWKNQIVEKNAFVMLSKVAQNYGVSEIPAKFLISPEGKLLPQMTFEEIDKFMEEW